MKNIFSNALYNAFGYVFPVLIALITTPYIVHKLTPAVYGIYVLAISIMGLMSFLDLGFAQGIIKFVAQYEAKRDYDRINSVINVSLIIYTIMGLIGFIVILSLSQIFAVKIFKIPGEYTVLAHKAFEIVAFGFFVNFLSGVYSNIPKALQQYSIAVKIQNAIWFCTTMTTVILLYFNQGLIPILLFYVVFQIVSLFVYYKASKIKLPYLKIHLKFDKLVFKEIFSFSFFTAVNNITGSIVFRVDKMIVGSILGAESVAFYQIPFMIVQMANGSINAISQFLFPAVSYLDSKGSQQQLRQLYKKSSRHIFALTIIITCGLTALGKDFITLWMGSNFAEKSAALVPIIALVFFFQSVSVTGFWFFNGLGYAKINMLSSLIGAVSYLIASWLFITKFGLIGAAASFAFTLMPTPYYFYTLHKLLTISQKWFLMEITKSLVIIALIMSISHIIDIQPSKIHLIGYGLAITVISSVLIYKLKIFLREDIEGIKLKFMKAITST